MRIYRGCFNSIALLVCLLLFFGCATYNPGPADKMPFREREQTQEERNVRVTAAVLSADETQAYFGLPLYKRGIQPIWLEIENKNSFPVFFLHYGTDPDYFPPLEVAYMHHITFKSNANRAMDRNLYDSSIGYTVPPGQKTSGFIFTNRQLGTAVFNVELTAEGRELWIFTYFINVPGLTVDYQTVDWENLYREDEFIELNESNLRQTLEKLPCCSSNRKGTKKGDPINLVIISRGKDLLRTFIRSGWDETRAVSGATAGSIASLGSLRQYRAVEPQYLFDRRQDVAFSKIREVINARSLVRLWLSPYSLEGKPIWVGQIQRGMSIVSGTTRYRIDPDVDEARIYLIQDFGYSQGFLQNAYVKGVGAVSISNPRKNYKGSIYYTDGLRLVLWLSGKPTPLEEIEFIDWEEPPTR